MVASRAEVEKKVGEAGLAREMLEEGLHIQCTDISLKDFFNCIIAQPW